MAATESNPLIFYDIPAKIPPKSWSPNMWKTRIALNYKKIPYRTEWISYTDIKPTFIKMGFEAALKEYDGSPLYTCPAIVDPTTPEPKRILESAQIALYLEEAYPTTPALFPEGTREAQFDFIKWSVEGFVRPILLLTLPTVPDVLEHPEGSEYFIRTRALRWGRPLAGMCPAGSEERARCWEALKKGLDAVAEIYDKNVEGNGEFFTGKSITFADIFVASQFQWTRVMPTDRDEGVNTRWEIIQGLNGGRWAKLLAKFDDYLQVC